MDNDDRRDPGRRRFLLALGGLGLAWTGVALYPTCRYLAPAAPKDPFKDGKAVVEKITPADVAAPGAARAGGYAGHGLVVFRTAAGELRAFDTKCTHAGCNVEFVGDGYHCNCHGGRYDLDGKNISGPPPRPLTRLDVVEVGGQLFVRPRKA
jgi:cytochrome b6-f complex iron-sulfur subunit